MTTVRGEATVRRTVDELAARFATTGVPTPEVDAELLVRHVLGWPRVRLLTDATQPLPPAAAARVRELAARRERREPLQLLVGSVGFRRLEIEVRPGVFIPRPETEVLAGEAIARTPAGGVVVEPCTGTGAVACAVADETAASTVVATDVSPEAAALARANAERLALDVTVWCGDLLAPLPVELRGLVGVLVSNPPYLAAAELEGLEPEVTAWDPPGALVSGPTGHELTDRLVAAAGDWLAPGGWLLLEVDPSRAVACRDRMREAGLTDATVIDDLTGAGRIVAARRP